jgi:hypothetical protein
MSDSGVSVRPTAGATYCLGGPDRKGDKLPQQGTVALGLDLEADVSDTAKLKFSGESLVSDYRDLRQFQLLNSQFPLLTVQDKGQDARLIRFRLPDASLSFYGAKTNVFLGYQKIVFGKTEFPLAPANTFSGSDYSAADQIPTYRSLPGLQGKIYFGSDLALIFAAAPSSEARNVLPFQVERLKASFPAGSLKFVNQGRALDVDGLLGFRGSWGGAGLLLTLSREHDHFFKIGSGALDPQNDSATLNGIYPSRETAAAEVAGASGNLVYWLQGNFSYYDHFQNGSLSSPLGDLPLAYSRYAYQGAAGLKYLFPEQHAYVAAQGFYGSLTGNGELKQAVASARGGIELLNGDLKLGALFNSYFESGQPKCEGFLDLTYQPVPGLEVSLGGRLAQLGIFSLAQPWYGYAGLRYKY